MTMNRRVSEFILGAIPILLILGLWEYLTITKIAPPTLLPSPGAVFTRFVMQLGDPTFLSHAGVTLYRLFCGFGLAVIVGVGLGIAGVGSPLVGTLMRPVIRVLAPVPKVALYPAFMLTLGFDHASKIALVFADAMFPILLATYQGALAVDSKLVWSARAMGVSRVKSLFTVVLMAALPSILTGCRIGLIISCIVVFLSEMISSTDGLGHLLVRAARNFQTVDVFVPLIAISALGLILNTAFNMLRTYLLRGFPEEN